MIDIRLKASNLITSYGKFKVSNITFELKSGDMMGLIGRSGSGKSTFIRTLLGSKKADSGHLQIFLDKKEIPITEVIGYSPQKLFTDFTIVCRTV